jgi:dUTP pyrophosphatase
MMPKKATTQIKRFDKEVALPAYKTAEATAFDLSARLAVSIEPHTYAYVPLNVAMKAPEGYWILMASRSSLHKRGVTQLNGVGIFDQDFCGDNDEYQAVLYNFTNQLVTIEKGERIMQAVVLPLCHFPIEEVESHGRPTRGGFGSTGTH